MVLGWVAADVWAASQAFSEWREVPSERTHQDRLQRDYFWPVTSAPALREKSALEAFLLAHPARSVELTGAASGRRAGSARVASWRPRRIVINVDAPEDARLTVNHFYFPGWSGSIPARHVTTPAEPVGPEGLIGVKVPRGRYDLVLELTKQWPEKAGAAVSLCSLMLILGVAWVARTRRSRDEINTLSYARSAQSTT